MDIDSSDVLRGAPTAHKEGQFFAPEFFRNTWINPIVVNPLEIHTAGPPHHLEYADQRTIAVEFVHMRPGDFPWSAPGLESRRMTGRFIVK